MISSEIHLIFSESSDIAAEASKSHQLNSGTAQWGPVGKELDSGDYSVKKRVTKHAR